MPPYDERLAVPCPDAEPLRSSLLAFAALLAGVTWFADGWLFIALFAIWLALMLARPCARRAGRRMALDAVADAYDIKITGIGGFGLRRRGPVAGVIEFSAGGMDGLTGYVLNRHGMAWVESEDKPDGSFAILGRDGSYVWRQGR
jgi:hypothetical protein